MEQVLSDDSVRELSQVVVGRPESFLGDSTALLHDALAERFSGRRVLILGGAGFIATQTLRHILRYEPSYVGIVDLSENGLAESIRTLRSSDLVPAATRLEPWLVDISSPSLARLAASVGEVDQVMNFAAVKHVRSERDLPSLLRMLQVNVLGSHLVARTLAESSPDANQFVVSTDKAADPANFMGASKRAMELAAAIAYPGITTARFANVAFSSGSLLESWLRRIVNRQPLAVPADTWRYFVTPEESGQLCSLAAVAPAASVVVPGFAEDALVQLTDALAAVLERLGLTPVEVPSVAVGRQVLDEGDGSTWPVVVTPRDTAGEKQAEVFTGANESAEAWTPALRRLPIGKPTDAVAELVERIEQWVTTDIAVTLDDVHAAVSAAVPTFEHIPATARLDDRA